MREHPGQSHRRDGSRNLANSEIVAPSNTGKDEVAERLTDMGNNRQHTKNAAKKTSRKDRMLANPAVRRWYDNLARGSELTAEIRIRRLDRFCEIHQMTPMQVSDLGMRDVKTMTDLLEDHITWMEEKEYSPGYIQDFVTAVKSWLGQFDVEIRRRLKIKNADYAPTLKDERVPDAQEMSEVFARASLRSSVIISLMAKSGLRPEVVGNHDGTDGLRMRDLPDIVIHQGVAKCIRAPVQVIVRRELSKARHQYFTFLTSSGTKRLVAYLNDRLAAGEPLHGDSPVVAPDYVYRTYRGANRDKPFLPTRRISRDVRETLRPRFGWRPYIMRAYFDTELLIAESKGRIAHDFRVFFMGHKGSIEARYTTNKGILPEVLVSEMREAFGRSEDLLDLEVAREDPVLQQKRDIHGMIQEAAPEQLGRMLEMLQELGIGKMGGQDSAPYQPAGSTR